MINVHCICHRLALACGDANSQLKYMATVEQLLVQLFKFLENSSVKTPTYLKMQLSLRKLDLPEGQRKQRQIGRKLQRACRTCWLSTDRQSRPSLARLLCHPLNPQTTLLVITVAVQKFTPICSRYMIFENFYVVNMKDKPCTSPSLDVAEIVRLKLLVGI